jgi:hypothetical protein
VDIIPRHNFFVWVVGSKKLSIFFSLFDEFRRLPIGFYYRFTAQNSVLKKPGHFSWIGIMTLSLLVAVAPVAYWPIGFLKMPIIKFY